MEQYIPKAAVVAEIERLKEDALQKKGQCKRSGLEKIMHQIGAYNKILSFIDTLEVKEVDVSNISENLAEAYEYLDYTSTGNLAHNKPMVSARLKKAIRSLFDAGLFELTHDKQYRMEHLGLKAQKGE